MNRSIRPWFLPVAVAALLAACSGDPFDDGEASRVEPAPAPTSPDAAAAPTAPSTSSGGGGSSPRGDAAVSETDASTDAAAPDRRIDPIEVGYAWTYAVTQLGYYPACPGGLHTSNVTAARTLAGKSAHEVESLCTGLGPYEYAVEGDRVLAFDPILDEWKLSLDAPVEEGHAWSDGVRDFAWSSRGTTTVPAGTFADCWAAVEDVAYDSFTVFCRGVGPVHWHYEDGFGNGYDAQLTAVSF